MPIVQTRNASMQQLNSADELDVENNNFGAEWYDHTGGQNFNLGSGIFTLNLDTQRMNSAPSVYSMGFDILTIGEAGLYLFSWQIMVSANGLSLTHAWLEQDPDTSVFAAIPSAVTYFQTFNGLTGPTTAVVTNLIQVGIDYRYRIRFEQSHGSTPATTVLDGSKLSVVRLFKNG